MKTRISLTEAPQQQLFLRVVPRVLSTSVPILSSESFHRYRIFLQKGLQVMGKSQPIQVPEPNKKSSFTSRDKFDFQVVNEKSLTYDFVIYSIDQMEREQRIQSAKFCFKQQLNLYSNTNKDHFEQKLVFPKTKITMEFILLINNIWETLRSLTEKILPEEQDSNIIENLTHENQLKKIQERPSEENLDSHFVRNQIQQMHPPVFQSFKNPLVEEDNQQNVIKTKHENLNINLSIPEGNKEQDKSFKMKKIALIILVLLIFAGLMAGGILPVGQKSKSKNKKKGKK